MWNHSRRTFSLQPLSASASDHHPNTSIRRQGNGPRESCRPTRRPFRIFHGVENFFPCRGKTGRNFPPCGGSCKPPGGVVAREYSDVRRQSAECGHGQRDGSEAVYSEFWILNTACAKRSFARASVNNLYKENIPHS